jgi:hypothetical protein
MPANPDGDRFKSGIQPAIFVPPSFRKAAIFLPHLAQCAMPQCSELFAVFFPPSLP